MKECLKRTDNRKLLYLIVDFSKGIQRIEQALASGVDLVQLREKDVTSAQYLERARVMRELTRKYHTTFIVNDRLDIALLSEADGVHLGQSDVPVEDARRFLGDNWIIGATAKTLEQAARAQEFGADYIGSGAWFSTSTKKDAVPITDETCQQILNGIQIPCVAVGGLTVENCSRPLELGVQGLAVSAGVMDAPDVAAAVRGFQECLKIKKI